MGAFALVVAGIVWQALWLGWPAALVSLGLVVSWVAWQAGEWQFTPRLPGAGLAAVAAFALHVAEEAIAGLSRELPALFDRPAWSDARFVVFNAAWLAVFVTALLLARPGRRLPLLPLLFLALVGGVANGVIHLGLVAWRGAYFPGAWTAPLVLIAGAALLRAMRPRKRAADGAAAP